MSMLPARPTHTGSARVQAAKARSKRPARPPTHQRTSSAAVALDAPARPERDHLVRHARRPLLLCGDRKALALRQEGAGAIEVLVQKPSGHQGWRPIDRVLSPAQLRAWLADGFVSSARKVR